MGQLSLLNTQFHPTNMRMDISLTLCGIDGEERGGVRCGPEVLGVP